MKYIEMEIKELGFYLWELSGMQIGNLGKYLSACPDYASFPRDNASYIVTPEKCAMNLIQLKTDFERYSFIYW